MPRAPLLTSCASIVRDFSEGREATVSSTSAHRPTPEAAAGLEGVDTPALVLDLDVLDANIERMARIARRAGVALRPHTKNHKTPEIAHRQLAAGAVGLACQKLAEAEVMAREGLDDLLIVTPIVGVLKIDRFVQLARDRRLLTVVDSLQAGRALGKALDVAGLFVPALIEIDVGYGRCGVAPGDVLRLAHPLVEGELGGLLFGGVMAYEGQIYDAETPDELRKGALVAYRQLDIALDILSHASIDVPLVSAGTSAGAEVAAGYPTVTELRCGSYALNDLTQISAGTATSNDCAITILSTVVSTPTRDRAVIDAGAKALSLSTTPGRRGYGQIVGREDLVISQLMDEHGIVINRNQLLRLGDRVRIIPNSHGTAVNEFASMVVVQRQHVVDHWDIAARGCGQ